MDARRKRSRATNRLDREPGAQPTLPLGATDNAAVLGAVLAKIEAMAARQELVLSELHEHRRLIHRMTVPVETVGLREAAKRLCRSPRTMERLCVKGVFTDGRPPGTRRPRSPLVFFADELAAFLADGEPGVRQLREVLGRR